MAISWNIWRALKITESVLMGLLAWEGRKGPGTWLSAVIFIIRRKSYFLVGVHARESNNRKSLENNNIEP